MKPPSGSGWRFLGDLLPSSGDALSRHLKNHIAAGEVEEGLDPSKSTIHAFAMCKVGLKTQHVPHKGQISLME